MSCQLSSSSISAFAEANAASCSGDDESTLGEKHSQDQASGSAAESTKGISITPRKTPHPQTSGLSHGLHCTKDIIRAHADAYFECIYPITTYGFFHQGTFLEKLEGEGLPLFSKKQSWFALLNSLRPPPKQLHRPHNGHRTWTPTL